MPVELEAGIGDTLVGQTLANRYLIESRLGEGAMGAVYRAKHVKVGRAFAVKVLHSRLLEDKKTAARFEREAELAGRLRHPNVIGVVDVGETPDGMKYMVMDFAEGPDLATLLSDAPFTPERVTHLTRQMLEGLFHAHEQGLIHRDFKPENVIVERDSHGLDVPRIVDFGIAILREGGESSTGPGRLTTNGLVLGTPHYMAPEQAVADPIDHRIDLFALGIMVYEMLCGKLPFDGTGAEVARANLLLDPPLISERVPYLEVDPLLEAFARKLMAKKRDLRPSTAKAARDLLDLIAKDREAAATALGVPLETVRAPKTTQPSQPLRVGSGEGTFPPPMRASTAPASRAITAPPTAAPHEHPLATEQTEPAAARKRRAPLIGAVLVGVGIVSGAAIVVLTGAKDQAPSTDQVAQGDVAPAGSAATPPALPAPSPEPPPPPSGSGGSAVEVAQPATGSGSIAVAPPETQSAAVKQNAVKQAKVKSTATANKVTTSGAATSSHPPIAEVAPKVIDARALASQYQAVGSLLKSLEDAKGRDATTDLWERYRRIRWVEASATQESRDATAQILSKLTSDIASRKK